MANLTALKQVGKAIKALDEFPSNSTQLGSEANVKRSDTARKSLVNILFSNGYELQIATYKVIKSTTKRDLI